MAISLQSPSSKKERTTRSFFPTTFLRRNSAVQWRSLAIPKLLSRIQLFYTCIALGVEERTGLQTSSLMTINHEGFGRVVL
ncbi:DUF269 domain-containing protein [Rhizobium mesoamericanum]|uniref:DUF269 domain-containing protein n=1 Tax=Rhizobium mesoamericanum TaxID=1079800 RepID=UPI0027D7BB35|nr:DUF269 domain-containing protein [Rhizobium mesoamericanum]